MLGYTAAEVMNAITPADISDPQEVIARAQALSRELGTPITPGFEALAFKASRGIEDIYELTYIRKDGTRFPALVSVTALRDAQDAIIGYLLIGTDNTARKRAEEEKVKFDQRLRDQQFYTRSLIEANIDALVTTDPLGIITDVNKQMAALTGCTRDELIGAPFKSHFADPERAQAAINLVLRKKKVLDYELTACARDGKKTVVSYNAVTFYDRSRTLQGVFVVARDITERKTAERNTALLHGELDHRVKNILAIVSAVISQAPTTGLTAEAFAVEVEDRVEAIAKAHNLLTRSGWVEASLRAIIATELAPYGRDGGETNLVITGRDVALTPKAALALAMAIHELASNAAKYGALSTTSGRLTVAWGTTDIARIPTLTLTWTETGGPKVQPPTRRGYGSTLIEEALTYNLHAKVNREFLAAGLRCTMAIPLEEVSLIGTAGKP
jgi:PAS domain S-box-containing protein